MAAFKRRDDAFFKCAELKSFKRLVISGRHIGNATCFMQPYMLWPNAGVIKARGYGMGFLYLAVIILQQIGAVAVENARAAACY